MTLVVTDIEYAERMLRSAVAGEPALSEPQIADMMITATSVNEDGEPVCTEYDLNRAASVAWQWKSSLTSDQYDLGGGAGKTLSRAQWHKHCMQMAAWYADGTFSVLGGGGNVAGGTSRNGMGVITIASSLNPPEV